MDERRTDSQGNRPDLKIDKAGWLYSVFPKWDLEDKRCGACGQVVEKQRGMTRQNLKRLVKPKFDTNEVIITLLLVMFVVMGYLYMAETSKAREFAKAMSDNPKEFCNQMTKMNQKSAGAGLGEDAQFEINFSDLDLGEDYVSQT